MPSFRVQFFKTLLSSDGHRFRCSQRTIDIDTAQTADEAIRAAWTHYNAVTNGIARYCADLAEAELIDTAGNASGHRADA
jgi:hypothetical protein